MRHLLLPEYMFYSYLEVTPEFLKERGVKVVLSDIDNTLAPYEQPEPDEALITWIQSLKEEGIAVALISNNEPERVELFNRELGLVAYAKSGKPFGKSIRKALEELEAFPHEAILLGDQLLTDALAAHLAHMQTAIVPPIRDKMNAFFRFKRKLEKPVIKKYMRAHPAYIYPFEKLKKEK